MRIALLVLFTSCASTLAPVITSQPAPAPAITGGTGAPLMVTRIAHSTVLLSFNGKQVLTDPWFSELNGYHHGEPMALQVSGLPKLAAVVASHGHIDHFDLESFKAYPDKAVPFFVGKEMVADAQKAGFTNVHGLAPWEHETIDGLTFTATPGAHGMPELTWVISGEGRTVFFGGDSLKIPELEGIAARVPPIDVALMPVNGLRAVGPQVVMNAEEAADVVAMLHPRVAVPMHYTFTGSWFSDTFILGYDGTPERFVNAVTKTAPQTKTVVLAPGELLALQPVQPSP